MRIPEDGPLGETRFEASVRAIVAALRVNKPSGGCVESVFTLATHLFLGILAFALVFFFVGIKNPACILPLDAYSARKGQKGPLRTCEFAIDDSVSST